MRRRAALAHVALSARAGLGVHELGVVAVFEHQGVINGDVFALEVFPHFTVVDALEAMRHAAQVAGEIVFGEFVGAADPVFLHQDAFGGFLKDGDVFGAVAFELRHVEGFAAAQGAVTASPEVVLKGMEAINDEARGEQAADTVFFDDFVVGEDGGEGRLGVVQVAAFGQQ